MSLIIIIIKLHKFVKNIDTYKSNIINVYVSLLNEQIIIIQYYTSKNFFQTKNWVNAMMLT